MFEQFTTAPQCKCKDIEECSQELVKKTNKCKTEPQCDAFIKKIGKPEKIRACLDKEQKDMEKLEKCVEKKAGPIGCTNDEHPKNLTIPMIPVMDAPEVYKADGSAPTTPAKDAPKEPLPPGQAPPEMGQYLMCVDQCAMNALEHDTKGHRARRSPVNCAFKLR
ncbi:hypothetical protein AAVH_03468 [Aphelenchoides avenae]|nr:hypothetical protein AAVH_03468 [Aphelenchus avenae]